MWWSRRHPACRRPRRARWLPTSASRLSPRSIRPCRCSRACRRTDPNVSATYLAVQQQLPATPTLEAFSSANQVGIAQLAVQYCNVMVNNATYLANVLPGVTLSATQFSSQAGTDAVTGPLAARVLGSGLHSMPAASTMTGASGELDKLIINLCSDDGLQQRGSGTGGHRRGLRDGVRQRQHVDQLSIGRGL